MIEVSQAFKDKRRGQLLYEFRLSDDGGQSWQEPPTSAYPILPLGSIQQRTEDPEPFSFVGPDMEITCRNQTGYWTNEDKTGKLDAGMVLFRVRTSIAGTDEWIKHIQGPIDAGTVRTEAGGVVSFTVRGLLNMLDNYLANVYNAKQLVAYTDSSGPHPGFPPKYAKWISIKEIDQAHPEGLFELSFNAERRTFTWAGGAPVEILESPNYQGSIELTLVGRNGERLTIQSNSVATETQYFPTEVGESNKDVSQWIYIKRTGLPAGYSVAAYCPYITESFADLKANLADIVDLDLDPLKIRALDIQGDDAAIASLSATWDKSNTGYNAVMVLGIGNNRWLVSSHSNPYRGTYIVEAGYVGVGGSYCYRITNIICLYGAPVYLKGRVYGNYAYLVADTDGVGHYMRFLNNWAIHRLNRFNLGLTTICDSTGAGKPLFWSSVDYNPGDNKLYMVLVVSTSQGQIYRYDLSTGNFAAIGSAFATTGPTMLPGIISHLSSAPNVYICISADKSAGKKIFKYIVYDIINTTQYTYDYETGSWDEEDFAYIGPISIGDYAGRYLTQYPIYDISRVTFVYNIGTIVYDDYLTSYETIFRPVGGKSKLLKVEILKTAGIFISGVAQDFMGPFYYYVNNNTYYMYCARVYAPLVGRTLTFTSGDNMSQSRVISMVDYGLSGGAMKIWFASPFPNNIVSGDEWRIYEALTLSEDQKTQDVTDGGNGEKLVAGGYKSEATAYILSAERNKVWDLNRGRLILELAENGDTLQTALDYSVDRKRLLCATPNNFYVADLDACHATTGGNQYPEVNVNDYDNKSVREMLEDLAVSTYGRLIPSEHYGKLKLWSRGGQQMEEFTISRNQYRYAGQWEPYFNYDIIKLDDVEYGPVAILNQNRVLSLSSPQICPFNKRSLAKAVYDNIGVGARRHIVDTDWLIWLEPGDRGYLELPNGSTVTCEIIGTETDFQNKTHRLYLQEV